MRWGMRVALALAVLVFLPGLREDFEDPKAVVVRVAGLAALAGALTGARRLRGWRPCALDVAVLALLAVELLATATARAPWLGVFGEPMQREGLLTSLALAGGYLAARIGTRGPADLERTLDVALAAVGFASLYALMQAARLDPVPWASQAVSGAPEGRPFGTLGHPNLLGVMSGAATAAALARAGTGGRTRAAMSAVAAVCGAATLVTLSRGAWLGGAAGALVAMTLLAISGAPLRPSRAAWVATGVFALLVVAGLLVSGWGARLAARFGELIHPVGGSNAARLEIWRAAVAAWRARPLLGHGPDSFAVIATRFQTPGYWHWEWGVIPFHAHSVALQQLATRGIVGALTLLAAAFALVEAGVAGWRRDPAARRGLAAGAGALAALAVAGAFGALGLSGAWLAALVAGSVATLGAGAPGVETDAGAERAPSALAARVVTVAIAIAVLGLGIADLRASRAVTEVDTWLARAATASPGRAEFARARAVGSARAACRLAPFDDEAARMRAEALMAVAEASDDPRPALEEATEAARHALALVPDRGLDALQLARVQAARALAGDPDAGPEAAAALARVPALMPRHALALDEVARLELRLGRPGAARDVLEPVVRVYPDDSVSLLLLASAHVGLGERPAAVDALRRAMAGDWRGREDARAAAARVLTDLSAP